MSARKTWSTLLLCSLVAAQSCFESYQPPEIQTNYGFLVVDGYLNSGNDATTINLSRTQTLANTDKPIPELNALVQIDEELGATYTLTDHQDGSYSINRSDINLDPAKNYRLYVKTADAKEYVSDYVPITQTPPIDSVSWKRLDDGEHISVNAHDVDSKTQYYRWNFQETWAYTSRYNSVWEIKDGVPVPRQSGDDIYHCWITLPSTQILIASTAALSKDVISGYPLVFIPVGSVKVEYRYSIVVQQYGMTKDAYEYWLALQKNTENLGTIFGPLPSQLTGNIKCVTQSEPVLGYFSATSQQEARIFINSNQLPIPTSILTGYEDCTSYLIPVAQGSNYTGDLLIDAEYNGPAIIGYDAASPYCIDCRLHGGTTTKPDFW